MMIAEQFVGGAHGVYEARGLIELLINKMTGGWLPFPRFRHTSKKRATGHQKLLNIIQCVICCLAAIYIDFPKQLVSKISF